MHLQLTNLVYSYRRLHLTKPSLLQTMALRMERQASNAQAIAEFLAQHPLVKRVNYPGLVGSPGYELNRRQATSGGSILSFETGR